MCVAEGRVTLGTGIIAMRCPQLECESPLRPLARFAGLLFDVHWEDLDRVGSDLVLRANQALGWTRTSSCPIAQMKPASSRATAIKATLFGLPRATIDLSLRCRQSCADQAISRGLLATPSERFSSSRLTCARQAARRQPCRQLTAGLGG